MLSLQANQAPIEYWQRTGFTKEDVLKVCQEVDLRAMAACISFEDNDAVKVRVTENTWSRRAGHYLTIVKFYNDLGLHPRFNSARGAVMVWMEDGLWVPWQSFAARAPVFAFGRHVEDHCTLLMPDPAFLETLGYRKELEDIQDKSNARPWDSRLPTVFWRGAATGLGIESSDWVKTARGRLVLLAARIDDSEVLDAKITKIDHLSEAQRGVLAAAGVLSLPVPFDNFLDYKYVVDADGYCCAWQSLFFKMASSSVVLKVQSPWEQWYFRDLVPWKHYIPLKQDLSDFKETFQWLTTNDAQAKEIARNAREFVKEVSYEVSRETFIRDCRAVVDLTRA